MSRLDNTMLLRSTMTVLEIKPNVGDNLVRDHLENRQIIFRISLYAGFIKSAAIELMIA